MIAPAQPAAPAAATKAGNLQGNIAPDGTFTSQAGPQHQGGAVGTAK